MKKLLSIIITVAMLATMLTAFSVLSSAEAPEYEADATWYDPNATELIIEDEADFLAFMQELISKQPAAGSGKLYLFDGNQAFAGQTVKLAADINLNPGWEVPDVLPTAQLESPTNFLNLGNRHTFSGTFDGQGHTVSGLYFYTTASQGGSIFGGAWAPKDNPEYVVTVKNVAFKNSYIATPNGGSSGIFAAVVDTTKALIENVYCDVDIQNTMSKSLADNKTMTVTTGGLAADVAGELTIKNSIYAGTINSGEATLKKQNCNIQIIGGLVGQVETNSKVVIEDSGFLGNLNVPNGLYVGKAAGRLYSTDGNTPIEFTLKNSVFAGTANYGAADGAAEKCGSLIGSVYFNKANADITIKLENTVYSKVANIDDMPVRYGSADVTSANTLYTFVKDAKTAAAAAADLTGANAKLSVAGGYDLTATWQANADQIPTPKALNTLLGATIFDKFVGSANVGGGDLGGGDLGGGDLGGGDSLGGGDTTGGNTTGGDTTNSGNTNTNDTTTTAAPETTAPAEEKGGCGSSIGLAGIALVAAVATVGVVAKKKED